MQILKESSLSRILHHVQSHDCGTISAFRSAYSLKDNLKRNRKLLAIIFSQGFAATEVNGVFVENFGLKNPIEVSEKTFFVVDLHNKGNLEKSMRAWGEEFDQDSIMFIPSPGEESFLWGTNHTGSFPGYGNVKNYKHRGVGSFGQFMTKVGNRPFIFESISKELSEPDGYLAKCATFTVANEPWQSIE